MSARAEALDASEREMRRRSLEHRIAIRAAASDIECYAFDVGRCGDRPGRWYDTSRTTPSLGSMGPEYLDTITEAADYLRLCGLIEAHPGLANVVRIKLEELPA